MCLFTRFEKLVSQNILTEHHQYIGSKLIVSVKCFGKKKTKEIPRKYMPSSHWEVIPLIIQIFVRKICYWIQNSVDWWWDGFPISEKIGISEVLRIFSFEGRFFKIQEIINPYIGGRGGWNHAFPKCISMKVNNEYNWNLNCFLILSYPFTTYKLKSKSTFFINPHVSKDLTDKTKLMMQT